MAAARSKLTTLGAKIRWIQANDFPVVRRRFRKEFLYTMQGDRSASSHRGRSTARASERVLQVDGVLVVGRDRENMNFIAVLNPEGGELRWCGVVRRQIQTQHGALFVRFEALHFDVAQSGRRQDASGKFEHIRDRFFRHSARKSPAASPFPHGNLRAYRRHQQGVARSRASLRPRDTMQKQIVPSISSSSCRPRMCSENARTARRRSPGGHKRVQRRGKRADIVSSGLLDFSHNVHANRPADGIRTHRPRCRDTASQLLFGRLLALRRATCRLRARDLPRKGDPPLAIHNAHQFCRNSSPEING